jgi:osmoprotectant transport system permease protein
MNESIADAIDVLPDYFAQHVLLSASALLLGVLLGLPLAVAVYRYPRVRWPILAIVRLIQTIPGLALLALFYPLLLGLSALTASLFGFGLPALGFLPTVLALTLYSLLPILQNSVTGLIGINADVIEAANAVGMTPTQRLLRVEAPLAAPVIMAGIRTAAVWTIGAATLSTPIGQRSLGNFIFTGLQTENWILVLLGCASAAALALITDQLLDLIQIGATRRDARRFIVGLMGLIIGTGASLTPLFSMHQNTYIIGAKNFSEQFILSELIAERLEGEGYLTQRKDGLGSAVAFRALASGDIDVYVDYSGTLWANVLERRDILSRDAMLTELARLLSERYGVVMLGSLGFENAYALAMRRDRALGLAVNTIEDLAPKAPKLKIGSDLEFLSRPEWFALKKDYALDFGMLRSYTPTFMYHALEDGDVDVISAFSSDGRIAANELLVLGDPKHSIPSYDAVILISPKRAEDIAIRRALTPLIGSISVEHMREANFMVDRPQNKASPKEAAHFLIDFLSAHP